MKQAFTLLYSRILVGTLLIIGVGALVVGRFRRRLRVSPGQQTRAPMLWLVNFTADARLHRVLRNLAARTRAAARGGARHRGRHGNTATQRLAVDLEAEIINLDERLVQSRSLDFDAQHAVVKQIRVEADRVDSLIERVTELIAHEANAPAVHLEADPIGAIARRLDELETTVGAGTDAVIDTSASSGTREAVDTRALDSPT